MWKLNGFFDYSMKSPTTSNNCLAQVLNLMQIWVRLCMLVIKKRYPNLGKGPVQGVHNTTLTTEAEYSINFGQ